jgi:hypothetical protein
MESKAHPKIKFTPDEDFLLKRFVMHFGSTNWNLASNFLPTRSARQCRERWLKYLCPTNSFEPFTPEEDHLLRDLFALHGSKWMKISRFFPNRTDIALKNRWMVLMRQDRKGLVSVEPNSVMEKQNSVEYTLLEPVDLPAMCSWPSKAPEDEAPWGDF